MEDGSETVYLFLNGLEKNTFLFLSINSKSTLGDLIWPALLFVSLRKDPSISSLPLLSPLSLIDLFSHSFKSFWTSESLALLKNGREENLAVAFEIHLMLWRITRVIIYVLNVFIYIQKIIWIDPYMYKIKPMDYLMIEIPASLQIQFFGIKTSLYKNSFPFVPGFILHIQV